MWKYTHNAYDFSILGNNRSPSRSNGTNSKIPGYMLRASVPSFHGFSAYFVASSVAARSSSHKSRAWAQLRRDKAEPESPHRHDELFNQTTHLQYQPWKRGRGWAPLEV